MANDPQICFRCSEEFRRKFNSALKAKGTTSTAVLFGYAQRWLSENVTDDSVPLSEQEEVSVASAPTPPTAHEIALEFAKMMARPTEDVTILAIRREVLSVLLSEQEKEASTKRTKKK